MADKLLDDFVESQIRDMIQEYPNKNNQQRRSHTILIDTSETKLARKSLNGGPQSTTSQFCINVPLQQNEEKRTRNGLSSNILPPSVLVKGGGTGQSVNQTNIFTSDDRSDHS